MLLRVVFQNCFGGRGGGMAMDLLEIFRFLFLVTVLTMRIWSGVWLVLVLNLKDWLVLILTLKDELL